MDQGDLIKERVRVVIVDLLTRKKATPGRLGILLGCCKNTICNYRDMNTMPKPDLFTKLARRFGVNLNWLYYGVGQMYHPGRGGREAPPEHAVGCTNKPDASPGSRKTAQEAPQPPVLSKTEYLSLQEEKIEASLVKAGNILRSETMFARSLYVNIHFYDFAMNGEEKREEARWEMAKLQKEVEELSTLLSKLAAEASKK
ncbi:MAG: hypothetical protein GY859_41450 [Desulfobacterales bacterium]|nr:hypothetical protein [Desulfobacterales bacterium]